MKQYLELLKNVYTSGTEKQPARAGMPKTIAKFGTDMKFDLREGFPILTTKKMYWNGIVTELLWILRGGTNIKFLVDNNCNIWNKDAYRWYLQKLMQHDIATYNPIMAIHKRNPYTLDEFIGEIKLGTRLNLCADYTLGDVGKIYGYQWRNSGNTFDQVAHVVSQLVRNPSGRYAIIDAWQPSELPEMALPPCHLLYQFFIDEDKSSNSNERYLDMIMYQRSCDVVLGVPFDISMGSLLMNIIGRLTLLTPRYFQWYGGDTHIYRGHEDAVTTQLTRTPLALPTLKITKPIIDLSDIERLQPTDFVLENYKHDTVIKAELFAGEPTKQA